MIRNLESLVRFRNAMGVMLAMSAIFAVVLSTISLPEDRATAQDMMDDPVEERAKAWWAALKDPDSDTQPLRVNVLLGKEVDAETTMEGRQFGDPTRTNTDPDSTPTAGIPLTEIEIAQLDYDHASLTTDHKDTIKAFVDGDSVVTVTVTTATTVADSTSPAANDLYAVGAEVVTDSNAIRGFQSVELWWNHLTCEEARTAIGEGNVAPDEDTDDTATGDQPEASAVCDPVYDPNDVTNVTSFATKSYADVKSIVDPVGQAILGLESPGSAMATDNTSAKAWWDTLTAEERIKALFGEGVLAGTISSAGTPPVAGVTYAYLASLAYGDMKTGHEVDHDGDAETAVIALDDDSKAKVSVVKSLINDRWAYIYHMGGMNDDGLAEVVYWWDSLDSTQRRIAVGVDNEPGTGAANTDYVVEWDDLNPVTDGQGTEANKPLEEQVFKVGQAILGLKALPDVAAWWNTLNADQMVYVVYGNPPMRTPYHVDDDDNPDTAASDDDGVTGDDTPITTVTMADKAVFQKPYDMLTGSVPFAEHLPTALTATQGGLLTRQNVTDPDTCGPDQGSFDEAGTMCDPDGDPDTNDSEAPTHISAKAIVDAIAMELFDPPAMLKAMTDPPDSGTFVAGGTEVSVEDDNDFDWPYNSDNKPANVADWWESTDCRVMRLAVGEDNQYLNVAVDAVEDDTNSPNVDESMDAVPEETSIYCKHFPGKVEPVEDDPMTEDVNEAGSNILSEAAQKRVVVVGSALLGLSVSENMLHANRPSFNSPAGGDPQIMGTAQVGAKLTVNTDEIKDEDDGPNDEDFEGSFMYQWLRNGDPIPGATSSSYVLTAADAGATISVRVSFIDGERYPEVRTSPSSLATSPIAGAPGEISKIVESIRGVTISAGGDVVLSVNAYGLQGVQDNKLSAGMGLEWKEGDRSFDDDDAKTPWEVTYTAPSSPGNYKITASFANDGDCRPLDKDGGEEMRDTLCTATFQVRVRREQPPVATPVPPVNPPGEIPGLIPDSDGNQYEVFTPVEGGTFDGGEGYSITVPSGAVPNGEYIGIRMSDDGAASNVGQTHQRYTLAGNMYGVHAVDASGAAISSYVLEAPAEVCVPLPAVLSSNISHLSLAAINSDGTLTVLSAQVRLNGSGGDTMVCGNLSNLPASVAVGSQGAPDAIPTATPMPEPELPPTGGTAPASSTTVLWSLLLAIAVLALSSVLVIGSRRRRESVRSK